MIQAQRKIIICYPMLLLDLNYGFNKYKTKPTLMFMKINSTTFCLFDL